MQRILLILALCCAVRASASVDDDWFDPAFIESNAIYGGTGFILVPSPEILSSGVIAGAIHRYQVKLSYGLWDLFELGVTTDLDGYKLLADGSRNQLFFARLRLLNEEKHGIALSVGADGLGLEDLGGRSAGFLPKPSLEHLERAYAVAGAALPFYPSLMLTAGFGSGAMRPHFFFNASKVLMPGLLLMGEYDGFATNLGSRFLLSPRIKLDFDFIDCQSVDKNKPFRLVLENNVRFGITYSEPWSPSFAWFKSDDPKKKKTGK